MRVSCILITKKGVITFISESGGQYGDQTGYLFGAIDPTGKEWTDQGRNGCPPVR